MKLSYQDDSVKIAEACLDTLGRRTGIELILVRCCGCNELLSAKFGGQPGCRFSDMLCPVCAAKIRGA
jgi:hypothetical protein